MVIDSYPMETPAFLHGAESLIDPEGMINAKNVKLTWAPLSQYEPVELPGSKSIAARALILAFIYRYLNKIDIDLLNQPTCDDTDELRVALRQLESWRQTGEFYHYNLGSGGTSLRFFLALVASIPGFEGIVDCSEALRGRPVKPLLDTLRMAGADIEGEMAPFKVRGRELSGKDVIIESNISSQFTSAMMMASLLWSEPFTVNKQSNYKVSAGVSQPYIEMTKRVMEQFRILAMEDGGSGKPSYVVESDWSAASYFYECRSINPAIPVMIKNLCAPHESLQGDSKCKELFDFKSDSLLHLNLRDTPDLVPALVVTLCMKGMNFKLEGVANLRFKESDRIAALTDELSKIGYILKSGEDTLSWTGERDTRANERDPVFDSHGDHRIAMALAMVTPRYNSVTIYGASAVTKSFPDFFHQLEHIGFILLPLPPAP